MTSDGRAQPVVAETATGRVRGIRRDDVVAYLGIPYGAPTGGKRRFLRPATPEAWRETLNVKSYGAPSPQMLALQAEATDDALRDIAALGLLPDEPVPSEDCLVLNVWTSASRNTGGRPVIVWFHGGGYVAGSAAAPLYNFASLVRRGDLVAVGVNHRLGAFGYLNLAELGDASTIDSANAGNLDLIAALEWVRDNIAAFGGDPTNVAILGNSGGAHKVSMLVGMPAARGLFHRAMLMSAADPGKGRPSAETSRVAEALLSQLGIARSDLDRLRNVPMKDLDSAQVALFRKEGANPFRQILLFWAVLDGQSVPVQPIDALAAGDTSNVPILIGITQDEVVNPPPLSPDVAPDSEAFLESWLDSQIGAEGEALAQGYRELQPNLGPADLVSAVVGDHFFRIPSIRFAEAAVAGGNPVYMYTFTQPDPQRGGKAPHAWDMPFFFDNLDLAPAAEVPGGRELAGRAADALIAFARTGDPAHAGLPEWASYSLERRATMLLGEECRLVDDPNGNERRLWDDVETIGLIPRRAEAFS
jgi:para-nitrobenzyl esterase